MNPVCSCLPTILYDISDDRVSVGSEVTDSGDPTAIALISSSHQKVSIGTINSWEKSEADGVAYGSATQFPVVGWAYTGMGGSNDGAQAFICNGFNGHDVVWLRPSIAYFESSAWAVTPITDGKIWVCGSAAPTNGQPGNHSALAWSVTLPPSSEVQEYVLAEQAGNGPYVAEDINMSDGVQEVVGIAGSYGAIWKWDASTNAFVQRSINMIGNPDLVIQELTGINDFGQIVGWGYSDSGQVAFRLDPQ